ncbi:transposase [Ilyomonas limi]|uniref:Transposase n=1 Tax=Ilyomonas limi TaxID=2575867 RepID=A0A4U3LAG0_9BACT|nr:transposase [Ilyomonas limi]TKK71659.1 transposase [Ilyomonas limi]
MSQGFQIYDQNNPYYLTFQVVKWVDVFTRNEYKQIVINSFDYCRKHKGLELYAYVLMTNHIHLIARAKEPFQLSDIIRDFKKFTANQLLPLLQLPQESRSDWIMKRFEFAAREHQRNSHYQLWTHENHAVELFTPAFTQQKMEYIHNNPVRTGIVEKPEDYLYSSARNYAGLKSVLEIDLL